jgi:hypothetical protein
LPAQAERQHDADRCSFGHGHYLAEALIVTSIVLRGSH